MKKSAVEFLVEALPMVYWEDAYYIGILEQAKEMEKEQIVKACAFFRNLNGVDTDDFETYYNEIFKKK